MICLWNGPESFVEFNLGTYQQFDINAYIAFYTSEQQCVYVNIGIVILCTYTEKDSMRKFEFIIYYHIIIYRY